MENQPLEQVFYEAAERYHEQVQALRKLGTDECKWTQDHAVLALLRSRDRIQFLIDQSAKNPAAQLPAPLLVRLSQDDALVGNWSKRFASIASFSKWKKSLSPPVHHWWWPEVTAAKPWVEWFLGGLTIALLTLCLALARDISTRFFTGAPGIWSSIGAIAPAVLALFATGGALTKVGKQFVDTVLKTTSKSSKSWPWIKFSLAACLTLAFFLGHFQGLPWAANRYHAVGERQYFKQGKLASAQGNFKRALQLNPNFPEANHHLALTYEDLRDFDSAKAEYVKAVNAGFLRSVNNLARLQIVEEEDYESAAVLLLKALQSKERDREDTALEYGLRKNLGWAWLKQERLIKAQGELMKANKIEATLPEVRPDAYCLLAMTMEQQAAVNKQVAWQQGIPQPVTLAGEQAEGISEVTKEWETCRQKIVRPEDDVWAAMADKALSVKAIEGKDPFTEPRLNPAPPPSALPVERVYIGPVEDSEDN